MFGDNLPWFQTLLLRQHNLGLRIKDKFKINLFIASCRGDYHRFILYLGLNSEIVTVELPRASFELILSYLYISNCFSLWHKCFFYFNYRTLLAGIIGYIGGSFTLWSLSKDIWRFYGMTDIFLLSYRWFSGYVEKSGRNKLFITPN
jgi:hypothetical protein